ncbi:1-(5-phosphoribosyl)-5-((5-phosphoribosylamino)methylideneamino) imidazole-4-carboxamide isomerase [Gammaproteobacteria bacterium]
MVIIPAIDIKNGKCVRLRQGRMNEETVFSDEPRVMARRWVAAGARRLHLVDLDGAFAGRPVNSRVIEAIVRDYPDLLIQVGGGIRDTDTIAEYLTMGVNYVILGTKAVTNPEFVEKSCQSFPGHILVGLDARGGKVAIEGWSKLSSHDTIEIALGFERMGVDSIIYTDIGRDGMMTGVNVDATVALARALTIPVIASGGISNLEDIRSLCAVADEGILGAITGRAIYEGTLDFTTAQQLADALTVISS